MSLIGDRSPSYEIILAGQTNSPIGLDKVMERKKTSTAIIFELWVSHFFPVYVYDIYQKHYDHLTRSWSFEPILNTKTFPGRQLIQKVEKVLHTNKFIKLSRKFCALPIPTSYLACLSEVPRVLDCLLQPQQEE